MKYDYLKYSQSI